MQATALDSTSPLIDRHFLNWQYGSAVRSGKYKEVPAELFNHAMVDYPTKLLPFCGHPAFEALDSETKRRISTFAWIAWNKRVVDTEEYIVGPALSTLMLGKTNISLTGNTRMAIRQAMIDEYFHSHMHEVAVNFTIQNRKIQREQLTKLDKPAYLYRHYQDTAKGLNTAWEKEIALLAWCFVGELSIYEFLTYVSKDESIQRFSRTMVALHERDEAVHGSLIAEVMKKNYRYLNKMERGCFETMLPHAIASFSSTDWEAWHNILEIAGVNNAQKIIRETKGAGANDGVKLNRSFSRIDEFCQKAGIETKGLF